MTTRLPFRQPLANGANINLNVNGSVTPQTFIYTPAINQYIEIESIAAVFSTLGNVQSLNDFLSISQLPNGFTLDAQYSGVQDLRVGIIRSNLGIFQFGTSRFEEKTIGNSRIFQVAIPFDRPPILDGSLSDYYSIIVNDNLTSIQAITIILIGQIYTL